MRTVRWILFLPGAFVASLVAGVVGNLIGNFWGTYFDWMTPWFLTAEQLAWLISGLLSALTFIWAGALIAPKVSSTVKWLLVGTVIVLGLASTLGGFVEGGNPVASLAGLAMIAIGIGYARIPLEDFGNA